MIRVLKHSFATGELTGRWDKLSRDCRTDLSLL